MTIAMTDADLLKLMLGKLNPQQVRVTPINENLVTFKTKLVTNLHSGVCLAAAKEECFQKKGNKKIISFCPMTLGKRCTFSV